MTLFRICLASLIFFSVAQANDWPQWRGPNHNGATKEKLALTTDSNLQIKWKKSLGIGGYSSVVLVADRAYTTFTDSKSDYAICLDADKGDEIWRFRIDDSRPARGNADIGPLATPVVSGNMLYAVSAYGKFYAITAAQGKMAWTTHLLKDQGGSMPQHGFTSSPLVTENAVLVQIGGSRHSLVSFEKKTGKVNWNIFLDAMQYSSPSLGWLAGKEQLLVRTEGSSFGIDTETGKILWSHSENLGQSSFATPIAIEKEYVFAAGFGRSLLLKISKSGSKLSSEEVWQSRDLKGNFSEPVYYNGHFYGYSSAFLTCVDGPSGKALWKSRQPGDGSLILVEDKLLVLSGDGVLTIVKASPEAYEEIQSTRILSGRCTTPVSFSNGKIYARSLREIVSVEVK